MVRLLHLVAIASVLAVVGCKSSIPAGDMSAVPGSSASVGLTAGTSATTAPSSNPTAPNAIPPGTAALGAAEVPAAGGVATASAASFQASPAASSAVMSAASIDNSASTATQSLSKKSYNPIRRLERSLVFSPKKYPKGNWQPQGLVCEDAWFTAIDGTKLHGWYVPHVQPRGYVLYCHGNDGNISDCVDVLRTLHDRVGVAVLGMDYRGFGRSEGVPSEDGVFADARAARAWLAQRAGIRESDVVLMGRSLGGGIVVDLAAKDGARGLILESTFTSVPEVGHNVAPWFPVRTLMRTKFDSLGKISSYHGALLQSHGTRDSLIPYSMGQQLFNAANEPKEFVSVANGGHNSPQPDEFYSAMVAFLDRIQTQPLALRRPENLYEVRR